MGWTSPGFRAEAPAPDLSAPTLTAGAPFRIGQRSFDRLPPTGMLDLGRPGHVWIAGCEGCRHKSLAPTDAILAPFGERTPLFRAAGKLRCQACGQFGAEIYLGELSEPERSPSPLQRG